MSCAHLTPPTYAGRWRDWHRGHGCNLDDGKPRTAEGVAEIAAHGEPAHRAYVADGRVAIEFSLGLHVLAHLGDLL